MDTPIGQIFATGQYVGALLKGLGDILVGPLHLDSKNFPGLLKTQDKIICLGKFNEC